MPTSMVVVVFVEEGKEDGKDATYQGNSSPDEEGSAMFPSP